MGEMGRTNRKNRQDQELERRNGSTEPGMRAPNDGHDFTRMEDLLSAATPRADEAVEARVEAHVMAEFELRRSQRSEIVAQASSKPAPAPVSRPLAPASLPQSKPAQLPGGILRKRLGRVASLAMGALGVALLAVLFLVMSATLGSRHGMPSGGAINTQTSGSSTLVPSNQPIQQEHPQSGAYTAYSDNGSLHIAAVAGYNLRDYKSDGFLFFYAMRSPAASASSVPTVPTVTAILQPVLGSGSVPTEAYNSNVATPLRGALPTAASTVAPLSSSTPSVIVPQVLKVIDIQPLGRIAEFDVGIIHTEWVDPAGRTLVLLVTPPGGKESGWQVTPFMDLSSQSLGADTSFFRNSPPEIGQVSVACPCGPQAFRLAILGRPVREAPPVILGIDSQGVVALMTEAQYVKTISSMGTPFPTEDTEHVQIAPTYQPTSTPATGKESETPGETVNIPTPVPTVPPEHQHFFIEMGDGGKGVSAIEPSGSPQSTDTGTSRITKVDVEQYVSTHTMQGNHVAISYESSAPSIVSIELMQFGDVYRRYTPEAPLQTWQGPYPPETQVYLVELQGIFRVSGGPSPGDLGTYHTGVWVFDASTGFDILEGGVGSILTEPRPPATAIEAIPENPSLVPTPAGP